jgi:hypothetical protein
MKAESAALIEADVKFRRPAARRKPRVEQAAPQVAQAAQYSHPKKCEFTQLDSSTPLINISFQKMGILVKFRPKRIFPTPKRLQKHEEDRPQNRQSVRSLAGEKLLQSDEALVIFKKFSSTLHLSRLPHRPPEKILCCLNCY